MKQEAKVILISYDKLTLLRWFRKKSDLNFSEINEMLKNNEINFNGDYNLALDFFNHIHAPGTVARLIIDYGYDMSGIPNENIL